MNLLTLGNYNPQRAFSSPVCYILFLNYFFQEMLNNAVKGTLIFPCVFGLVIGYYTVTRNCHSDEIKQKMLLS